MRDYMDTLINAEQEIRRLHEEVTVSTEKATRWESQCRAAWHENNQLKSRITDVALLLQEDLYALST